ncbi:MAG: hypothetical protein IT273_14745 [Chitinophagales bacterium]|nr:hypothetical protein [Chitinophagales bacterium]
MLPLIGDFRAHGKLLLSGEYAVLDGALSLALPTRQGQELRLYAHTAPDRHLHWQSYDEQGNCWLDAMFDAAAATLLFPAANPEATALQGLLQAALRLNPRFGQAMVGIVAQTTLQFPRIWGLGSSSTLVSLVAQWAGVNPYALLENSFGGSGYDIACATARTPILYQRATNYNSDTQPNPYVQPIAFAPPFADRLYFVHLGHKQNSRQAIDHYRQINPDLRRSIVADISDISRQLGQCSRLSDFEQLLRQHEQILSQCLQLPTAQSRYFADYNGTVKSLGAWGGDFVLATAAPANNIDQTRQYFAQRGFSTLLPYAEMIL